MLDHRTKDFATTIGFNAMAQQRRGDRMEHRWGSRVECNEPVLIETSQGQFAAELINLSLSGALVRGFACTPRRLVLIQFSAECTESDHIQRVAAHIVRQTEDGVGIEWAEFAAPLVKALCKSRRPTGRSADNRYNHLSL